MVTQIVGLGIHTDLHACLSVLRQAHRGKGSRAKKPEELISLPNLQESSVVQPKTALCNQGCTMHACLPGLVLDKIYSRLVGACLYISILHSGLVVKVLWQSHRPGKSLGISPWVSPFLFPHTFPQHRFHQAA